MSFQVKFSHAVILREAGKPEKQIGKFVSFTDSTSFGDLPKAVFIEGFAKKADIIDILSTTTESFLFGFDPLKEYNKELIKFHEWLVSNSHKVANILVDKYHSKAIISPALFDDESELKLLGYRAGFVCKILDNKNPQNASLVPSAAPPPFQTLQKAPSIKYSADSTLLSSLPSSYSYINPSLPQVSTATLGTTLGKTLGGTKTLGTLGTTISSVTAPPPSTINNVPIIPTTTQNIAEDHYNKLKRDKETRHLSQLFHMRNLNNFTKAELIEESLQFIHNYKNHSKTNNNHSHKSVKLNTCSVLELACGKGGDIMKWMKNNTIEITRYIGMDIAENSIKEFVERLLKRNDNLHDRIKIEKLIVGDLNSDSLSSSTLLTHSWIQQGLRSYWKQVIPLQAKDAFDVISCQFAMHYMFRSSKTVNHFFHEISNHLQENGLYIATTIDYRILIHYIMKAKYGPKESSMSSSHSTYNSSSSVSSAASTNYDAIIGFKSKEIIRDGSNYLILQFYNEFNKLLLQIELKEETVNRLMGRNHQRAEESKEEDDDDDDDDWFGIEYNFILHDSDEVAAVNSPEFIVPIFTTTFQQILNQHQLQMNKIQNFHDFIQEKFGNLASRERMNKMDVFNVNGTISEGEWMIARLYTVLILQKTSPDAAAAAPISSTTETIPIIKAPSLISHESKTPPGSPPRYEPHSPQYQPRRIGALVDPNDPVVKEHQAKFAFALSKPRDLSAISRKRSLEQDDNIIIEGTGNNEEDAEEEVGTAFFERIGEKAMELAGGSDIWDSLPEDECDRFIEKAKIILKLATPAKTFWKIYPPRSPDHPPPNYHKIQKLNNENDHNGDDARNKMEQDDEDDGEDEEEDIAAKLAKIGERAIELAGGDAIWETLDDETCNAFIELAQNEQK